MWTKLVVLLGVALLRKVVFALGNTRLYGVNYSLRVGPDWAWGTDRCKTFERLVAELTQLQDITDTVRVFSMTDCDTGALLLQATQSVGLGLWLGIWVGPNQSNFVEERNRLLQLLLEYDFSNVLGIHVASEAIYREDITAEEAIALRNTIKQDMVAAGLHDIPITVADIADTYLKFPDLVNVDSMALTANLFPFWEPTVVNINGDSPDNQNVNYPSAAEFFYQKFWFVEQLAGSRQIIITETGWPDAGVNKHSNVASSASMAKWLRDFVCLANARGWQYFWFDAYDSSWRRVNEQNPDDVEGHFGLFDEDGSLKPHIRDLVIDCEEPYWDVDPNGFDNPTMRPTMTEIKVVTTAPIETAPPTDAPITALPTQVPSLSTLRPTSTPSKSPSMSPVTDSPTGLPTTAMPTSAPTPIPTLSPTLSPSTPLPTNPPSSRETDAPVTTSQQPTDPPTKGPSDFPSEEPSVDPVEQVLITFEDASRDEDNFAASLVDVPISKAAATGCLRHLSVSVVFALTFCYI